MRYFWNGMKVLESLNYKIELLHKHVIIYIILWENYLHVSVSNIFFFWVKYNLKITFILVKGKTKSRFSTEHIDEYTIHEDSKKYY